MWRVVIKFGPGNIQVYSNLKKEEGRALLHPALTAGCVEVKMFLQPQEDSRDQPDYPTE